MKEPVQPDTDTDDLMATLAEYREVVANLRGPERGTPKWDHWAREELRLRKQIWRLGTKTHSVSQAPASRAGGRRAGTIPVVPAGTSRGRKY